VTSGLQRLLFFFGLVVILVPGVLAGLMWFDNNSSIRALSRGEFVRKLDHALPASRAWVLAVGEGSSVVVNQEGVALLSNPALMHMVADCARASGDPRLQSLATSYFHMVSTPYWWGRLVDPSSRFERPPDDYLRDLEQYQRWFMHAMAPGEYPLSAEDRVDMFSPDKYRTGNLTHQLFALYFYRNFNGATPNLDRLIRRISVRIASEAAIDFRVTDLYLQRIAVLLAVGQLDLVKRRWVERALAAQQPNGGWSRTDLSAQLSQLWKRFQCL
jgi:hypothetical protein